MTFTHEPAKWTQPPAGATLAPTPADQETSVAVEPPTADTNLDQENTPLHTSTQTDSKPVVFVVDPDETRQNFIHELVKGLEVVVECHDTAVKFLAAVCKQRPGCVIADINLPDLDGHALQTELIARNVTLPVIFLSSGVELRRVVSAIKLGAMDVLEKPFRPQHLVDVVRQAIDLDAEQRRQRAVREESVERFAVLTSDERVVMDQLVAGKTNKEIAADMGVSLRTVQFRRSGVMKKLNIGSRSALIEAAVSLAPFLGVEVNQSLSDAV